MQPMWLCVEQRSPEPYRARVLDHYMRLHAALMCMWDSSLRIDFSSCIPVYVCAFVYTSLAQCLYKDTEIVAVTA